MYVRYSISISFQSVNKKAGFLGQLTEVYEDKTDPRLITSLGSI
jgi:hypothetical protein